MRKPKPFVTFQKKPKVTLVTKLYEVLRTYVRSFGAVSRSGTGIGESEREVMGGSQLIGNWYCSPLGDAGIAGEKKADPKACLMG